MVRPLTPQLTRSPTPQLVPPPLLHPSSSFNDGNGGGVSSQSPRLLKALTTTTTSNSLSPSLASSPGPASPVSSFSPLLPGTTTTTREGSRTGSHDVGDGWNKISSRAMLLFNGETLSSSRFQIEDMNALVSTFIERTLARTRPASARSVDSTLATGLLLGSLTSLFSSGSQHLSLRLSSAIAKSPAPSDETLLLQLSESWTRFLSSTLPLLEAIFLPLELDDRLIIPSTSFGADHQGGIRVRHLALESYRDEMLLTRSDDLERLYRQIHDDPTPSPPSPSPSLLAAEVTAETKKRPPLHQRVPSSSFSAIPVSLTPPPVTSLVSPLVIMRHQQMLAILASLLTDDDRQGEIERLARTLRKSVVEKDQQQQQHSSRRGSKDEIAVGVVEPVAEEEAEPAISNKTEERYRERSTTLESTDSGDRTSGSGIVVGSAVEEGLARQLSRRRFLPAGLRQKKSKEVVIV